MSITQEDLQKYLDNPNDVPHDVLLKLAAEDGKTDPGPAEEPAAVVDPAKQAEAAAAASVPTDAAPAKEQEAPILSKDGKHTIPYDVLKSERDKRQAAEGQMADYQARIDALQAQLASGQAPTPAAAAPQAQAPISDEELAVLREDFPAFAKVLEAQMAQVSKLEAALTDLTGKEAAREAETAQTVASTVQELIDANPKLLHLQTKDPEGWKKAIDLDNYLQTQPGNPDMAARFVKVVAAYEAINGVITVPAAPVVPAVQDKEAAKAAAKQILDGVKPAVPASLSDLPGGAPVEATEVQKLENMSAAEIGAMFAKMSTEQRNTYLNGL